MTIRSQYDNMYDNYINGNLKDFARQFHSFENKADFIDYVVTELDHPAMAIAMMKTYFNLEN